MLCQVVIKAMKNNKVRRKGWKVTEGLNCYFRQCGQGRHLRGSDILVET